MADVPIATGPRLAPDLVHSPETGLPASAGAPKTVVIMGAGLAGLVAGYELARVGHRPIIVEARQRVGGRIYTLREPFTHGLYAEAGGMRIPATHDLTVGYCRHFGLRLDPFTMGNPQAYYHLRGRRCRIGEAADDPSLLPYELADHERGRTPADLWTAAIADLVARIELDRDAAWSGIVAEFDDYSVFEYLVARGFSEEAIEAYGLLENQEALLNSSFLEAFREEVGGAYRDLWEIEGGMDRLPNAFLPALAGAIRFGAQVHAISQDADGVDVHVRTAGGRFTVRGDYAICTLPFPVLRHIEVLQPFSRDKQRAIRQLHYDASTKILMQCRRRFWEEDDGIFGGGTITDLPIRNLYYPDHGRETGRGVLLASYTWSQDADRWASLAPHERLEQALENVAVIHPQVRDEFEVGTSYVWHDDPFAGGAFALFDPGQQTRLFDAIGRPEGRIHFAGEHVSLHHAWIQGALESGLRAARTIHLLD